MSIKVQDLFYRWIESTSSLKQLQKEFNDLKNFEEYKPSGLGPVYFSDIEKYLSMRDKFSEIQNSLKIHEENHDAIIGELRSLFAIVDNRPITAEMTINNYDFLMKGEFVNDRFTLNQMTSY